MLIGRDHCTLNERMREIVDRFEAPRFGNQPAMLIAGIGRVYTEDPGAGFAQQWSRLKRYVVKIPAQVREARYGVLRGAEGEPGCEYVCGLEVFERAGIEESMRLGLPEDWTYVEVPEQHYAIFTHDGPVSTVRRTWAHIWEEWLPASGRKMTNGPVVESVNDGGIEIWMPVEKR
jgi:AraC family transcriptional regulator